MNKNKQIDFNNHDKHPSESLGSKILLTNHHLNNFAGSEITTLETALVFKGLGYDVSVATFSYDEPLKTIFEQADIRVFNLLNEPLPYKEYDLAWCHHSPVLSNIISNGVKIRRVVYRTLSTIEPLEALPCYVDDLDIVLAVSDRTAEYYYSNNWIKKENISVFPNSVPEIFFSEARQIHNDNLKKIAIVSNHIPQELLQSAEILRKHSIEVDFIGCENYGIHKLVNPETLLPYDLVISIGKTVQYCFALKIPVYCYDRFGGPGYITDMNYEKSASHNFSGRCYFRKVEANVLVNEILDGYNKALKLLDYFRAIADEKYNLENNTKAILRRLENTNVNRIFYNLEFSKELKIQLIHNEYYLQALRRANIQDVLIQNFKKSLEKANVQEVLIQNYQKSLKKANEQEVFYKRELNLIYSSRSWRYTALLRKIGFKTRKILKNILFNSQSHMYF